MKIVFFIKKPLPKLSVRDITLLGMLVAVLEAGKVALNALPNIEVVTLLIIFYTRFFGRRTILVALAFAALECLFWGFGPWTIMYLYVWPLLVLIAYPFRKVDSTWFWSVFSSIFGFLFGVLCSFVYFPFGGIRTVIAWWIAGIPWDITHGVSNFILMLVLYYPLSKVFKKFLRMYSNSP